MFSRLLLGCLTPTVGGQPAGKRGTITFVKPPVLVAPYFLAAWLLNVAPFPGCCLPGYLPGTIHWADVRMPNVNNIPLAGLESENCPPLRNCRVEVDFICWALTESI